jgi:hypothetical protein
MFHIPDVGIRFKAPFKAVDTTHGDLAALLALLEFIDSNQKYFDKSGYKIFGTNRRVVNGVNCREHLDARFDDLLSKALDYRKKYKFSLRYVPPEDNQAYEDPAA